MALPGCIAAITATLHAAPAEGALVVDASACPDLSGDRIAELLAVEHPELREASGLRIALHCPDVRVRITIEDSVTQKTLERLIDAPPIASPEREREIALATSSLIVASWLELFVPADDRHPPPPPASPRSEAAERVVADVLARSPGAQPVPNASLQLESAIRWRALPEAFTVLHFGLRAGGFVHRNWEVFGRAAFEYGRADRDRGQVQALAVSAGPGVAWHLRPAHTMGLEVFGALAVGYDRLAGKAPAPDVDAGAVGGATGAIELGLGPRFRARSFVMAIDLTGGYGLETPRGIVTQESPVTLGGFFVGVGLRLGAWLGAAPAGSDLRSRPSRRDTRSP